MAYSIKQRERERTTRKKNSQGFKSSFGVKKRTLRDFLMKLVLAREEATSNGAVGVERHIQLLQAWQDLSHDCTCQRLLSPKVGENPIIVYSLLLIAMQSSVSHAVSIHESAACP